MPVRIIADDLSRICGQQVVVVNQPGPGGAIAQRAATSAAPDGYTFGVTSVSAFVAIPGTADNLPVRVPRNGTQISEVRRCSSRLRHGWTLPDLIARAKQRPGELSPV